MWQFIIPIAISLASILICLVVKSKKEIQEDPTCDVWHDDYEDIWRKTA